MPLPSTQPWLLPPTGGVEFGTPVTRQLFAFFDPNRYTRQSGAFILPGWTIQNGTPINSRPTPVTTPGGRGAIDSSSSIQTITNAAGQFDPGITVDGWFCPRTYTSASAIFREHSVLNGSSSNVTITAGSPTGQPCLRVTVAGGFTADVSVNGSLPSNTWTHVAVTATRVSAPYGAVYLNGRFFATNADSRATRPSTSVFHLHTQAGQLGEWKFYNRLLDASEILQNYNTLAPAYGRPIIPL